MLYQYLYANSDKHQSAKDVYLFTEDFIDAIAKNLLKNLINPIQ